MPRFKALDNHVRQAVVAMLKQRLLTKERVLAWLQANDADRPIGTWYSVAINVEKAKDDDGTLTIFDSGHIN